MNIWQADNWRRHLRRESWYADLTRLGASLRGRPGSGRLLVVGHPDDPPWHFTAHLEMLSRYRGVTELQPVLADVEAVAGAGRGDAALVISEQPVTDSLLDRLDSLRAAGGSVFGLTTEDAPLLEIAHDAVAVDPAQARLPLPGLVADFELVGHVLGIEAVTVPRRRLFAR